MMIAIFMKDKSNKAKTIREQIKYNHCLGSTSYSGMLYRKVSFDNLLNLILSI